MRALSRLEQKLESAISGVFARAFRSAVQPVEIAAALQREADNNTQILSRNRRLIPNDFRVELSGPDMDRLSAYDSAIARDLTEQLQDHAEQQSYVFPGPIAISFEEADDLTTGRFRVTSRAVAAVHGRDDTASRARAVLEINGSRHPLFPPGLVIGRGTDADIRINDPGVSRHHVEFAVSDDPGGERGLRVTVRDLGSTNGMLIDGHRATSVRVRDGSVVKIGHTEILVRVVDEAALDGLTGEDHRGESGV
jgi:FhaA, N-terminal domain/FHA domain